MEGMNDDIHSEVANSESEESFTLNENGTMDVQMEPVS